MSDNGDNELTSYRAPNSQALRGAIETIVSELAVGDFDIHYHETNNSEQYLTIRTSEQIPGVEQSPIEKYDLEENEVSPRDSPISIS